MPAYYGRVSFEGHDTLTGALVVNVLHVEVDVLTDPPNWTNIATDMHTWLGTQWNNLLDSAYTYDQVVVTDEDYVGSTHGQGIHVVGTTGTRSGTDDKLDPAVCLVGTFKTATAKRYARGHMFMPPARHTTCLSTNGTWNTSDAYWVAAGAFLNAYLAGHTVSSTGYAPIIYSRTQQKKGDPKFTFPVVGVSLKQVQHWLRSRSTAP